MQFFIATAVALAALTAAAPAPGHVLHEKRHTAGSKWVKRSRVPSGATLPIKIGLTQSGIDSAADYLHDVSNPSSSNYGKHWTPEQILDYFKPHDDTVSSVKKWLTSSGISADSIKLSGDSGWLSFDATTSQAEKLFNTEFHLFEHSEVGTTATACDEYHLPSHIRKHVDYITPGVKLIAPRSKNLARRHVESRRVEKITQFRSLAAALPGHYDPNDLSRCDVEITPNCIQALYKFGKGDKADPSNAMGVFESLGDTYAKQDLDLYYKNYTSWVPQGTYPILKGIDGGVAPYGNLSNAGGESDLDFELAIPIVYPQKTIVFQTDDMFYENDPTFGGFNGFFNTFLDAFDASYCPENDPELDPKYPDPNPGGFKGQKQCGIYKAPNVISISYAGEESDLPAYYQQRQCNEWLKLGLAGTSVFVASGDSGVGGPQGQCLGADNKIFSPGFPNTCPWITNVGATKVYPGHSVKEDQPESAANDLAGAPYSVAYSSGGGFSNVFPIPQYQKDAVARYFKAYNPPYKYYSSVGNNSFGKNGGVYNRQGRGFPDVAANGDNIAVYSAGRRGMSGGTSASTPIFAALINRVNEERIAKGKKSVGFVNTVLYQHPEVLNDVVNGSNPNCGTNGFDAVKGWDPVTGLGTPIYPKLLSLFLELP